MTEGRILYDYHFQPKRLFSSFSVKAQASLREALAAHKIPYIVNAVNIAGGFGRADIRAATGGVGLNLDYAYEYVIYVRKRITSGQRTC